MTMSTFTISSRKVTIQFVFSVLFGYFIKQTGAAVCDMTWNAGSYNVDENEVVGVTVIATTDFTVVYNGATALANAFSLSHADPGPSTLFAVNSNDGKVTSNAVLNYEEHGPTQQVYIICHTDAGDVQYSIQVDIVDMEDEPVFINLPATISIPENILTTTTIATVDCSDEDGDPVTYDIDSQDPGSPTFTNTGPNIFAPVGLDFDADPAKRSFELTISCAGTTSTPTAILTVIVQEEYDEPPVFDSTAYDGNVDEDQPAGTVVTWTDDPIVGCTDADVSVTRDDDALYYTISGTNADHFNCDYLTGLVTTARTLEADGGSAILSYTLTLTATDKGGNTDTADLNIVVNGINDLPVFSPSGYTASVAEETVTGTSIIDVTVTDINSDALVVSIASGDDADAKFTITGTTSPYTIETTTFPTDYEDATLIANNHLYTLLVTADDGGGILTTATVVIEITSENEDTPAFTTFPAVVLTMLENSPSGTTVADVGDIVAEDSDEGSDGIISYSIDAVDPNVNKFYIEPSTGEIVTIGTFDYETDPQRYTITVMAADDGNPSNTVTDDIILDIEDYNDNEPIFSQNIYYRDDVVEGSPVDTSVLALTTTDADSIALTTIQYEFVSGNDDDLFKIDQPTETIQIKNIIDLDAGSDDPASYILVIRAVDGGTPELSGTTTVNIVMEAVNDHDPVFGATSPITLTVSELDPIGTSVGTIVVSDDDYGSQGDVILTIEGGDTGDDFQLDPDTGLLELKSTVDWEVTGDTVTLNIKAVDGGSPAKTATLDVDITVTNDNDNEPTCVTLTYIAAIGELSSDGTSVAQLDCSDDDLDILTHAITAGNFGNFEIDNTGLVTISVGNTIDFESGTTSYELTIQVSDGLTTVIPEPRVNIEILAENDEDPYFNPDNWSEDKSEDTPLGDVITEVSAFAFDSDDTSEHGIKEYAINSVTNGGANKFQMDTESGQIKLFEQLDYDTMDPNIAYYELEVMVTDGSGATDTATVTINVLNANDIYPSCSQTSFYRQVNEGTFPYLPLNTSVLDCSDDDTSGALTYSLPLQTPSADFSVDSVTGEISLSADTLDYESGNIQYALSLRVSDAGVPPLSSTVKVYISVKDVNEFSPSFAGPWSKSVPEDTSVGTDVETCLATDGDSAASAFGVMTYGITNGDPNDHFSIDRNSAVVTIKAPLDRETIDTYYLRIVATDGGGRAGTQTLTVALSDVNDVIPHCTDMSFTEHLSEDTISGATTVLFTLDCSDEDLDDSTLTYTMVGDDKFGVNVNGEVFLQSNVDYDAGDRSFALQVYVNDTVGQYVVVEGSIVVDPVNEFDPEFQPTALYTPTVSENTAVGSTIVTVLASDGDMAESATTHGVVIYSIDEFACNCSEFMLDTASGAIILLQQLDYEGTTSYTISIEATDSVTTVTGTVVVTVTDVNDNAPKFTSTGYSASVNEDDATPQAVKIVVATDRDSNLNNNNVIEYSITDGNGDGFFTIGASSGEIITTGLIDYESYESFVLEVTAKDKNGGANANSDTSRVTISILPVNEYTPVFQSLPYDDATVIENAPLGKSVYQVGATDDDAAGHVHGQVRFSITSGNSAGHFVIDEMDGVISTVAELDRETRSSYDLVVTATDSSAALNDERSAEENVTITVTDVNDNTPVFVPAVYSVSISESLAVGETVLTLTTNDLDQGVNKLRDVAKLSGDADGDFTLNGNDIVIANALAYHIKDFYEISYEVTDQGSPPLSSEGLVTITVRSENDFPPVFAQATDTVTWSEDTPIGTVLYTAVATDDDTGEHGTLYYFITDGDPDVVFLMDKNTGEISLNLYLDHETVNSYDLEITAYDNEDINAADALNDVMILTIVVDDENDNRPLFGQDQYTINIDENIAIGTNIITVVATDEDAGVNSDIQYSIVAGVGQDNVEINPTTGVVSTVADIDYEMYVMYSLMIEAVDGGTPSLTGYTNIQISVNDLNDNSPQVSPSLFTVAIPEDTAADVLVTPIQVTDADSTTNGEILCVITSGDPTGQFYVDADNCDLYTSAVALDRETKDTYNLIINATDGGVPMLYDEGELTVLITDVNDNDPILNPASYSALLDEDTPVGTVVFDVDATDADINENADLTYALTSGNDLGHFTIDQDTGIITVEQLLDRETVDAYNMIVTVTDDGTPTRSNTADVTLNLNDVNDNAPTFTMATYAFVVQENVDISTSVGQLAATDPDLGANGFIAYSIESGANSDHFAINSNTGEIHTSAVIDRESISQYSLVCKARDLGSVSQFTLVDVVITVEDENDNDPVYESTLYEIFMDENSDIGTVVVTVVATDADTGANGLVTYSIPNTDDVANTYFDVDLGSGEITVKTTLDRELYETIEFLVYATDNGSPERTDTTTVIVTIGDLNDNYPTFSPSFYSSELSYLNDLGEPVLTVTATDTDVGQTVTYYFQETNDLYELDRNTGNIRVIVDRQPSVNTKYTVYVEGRDDGTPQKSSLIDATVRIDTFNPYDRLVEFYLSVSEDYFELSRDDFITSLTGIIQEDYPTGRCGVSHIIRREVGSSSTSTRRLLVTQDHELTVYVYGVRDDEADSLDGLSRSKNFVSNTYLFNKFTSDSSGTPSDELLRDPYTQWSIDQVLLHEDPNSLSWFEEWWGILILSLISLLLLALILLGIFLIYYFCCRKKKKTKSKKPVDKQPRTTTREGWGKNTAYKPSKTLLPDSNILVLPTARPGNAERKKPEANKTRQSEQELESIPKTPAPTAFDGRAVDPASGRIYEYNSKTGQRRWLKAQNYDVNVPGNVTS